MVLSLISVSTPSFFLALVIILIFSLYLGWFPSMGVYTPKHYVLPILALGTQSVGLIARMTRSAMLDVLHQDYIRTSRSKGVSENVIEASFIALVDSLSYQLVLERRKAEQKDDRKL